MAAELQNRLYAHGLRGKLSRAQKIWIAWKRAVFLSGTNVPDGVEEWGDGISLRKTMAELAE